MNKRKTKWSQQKTKILIGLNTGCSSVIAYKKLSVSFQRKVIEHFLDQVDLQLVLLGGPEDTLRNQEIAEGLNVVSSATEGG